MKRGTESIVRLGKSVEPADFSGINVLSTVILGKKESATKDFNGLFITDAVLLGKKISHAAVVTATVHGVSPLSLPDAVAAQLDSLIAFGGTEQKNLPAGYTELEYIRSNGTAYIDTGYSPTSKTRIELVAKMDSGAGNVNIVGSATAESTGASAQALMVINSYTDTAAEVRFGVAGSWDIVPVSMTAKNTFSMSATEFRVNGVVKQTSSGIVPNTGNKPFYLFQRWRPEITSATSKVQIYEFNIYENEVLVRHMVPAKQGTTVGLYDTVSGTFFTNAGTGEFIAGAPVEPVLPAGYQRRDFIYMMDSSYLNTGIIPTYDGKIEIDFQTTTLTNLASAIIGGRTATYGGILFSKGESNKFDFDAFGTSATTRYSDGVPAANTRYKYVYDNQVMTLSQGDTVVATHTFTEHSVAAAALYINGLNTNGSLSLNRMGIYVYSFRMYNASGELVADYIPCIKSAPTTEVGFYDTVSGEFKGPTAGTFAAGSPYVPTQPVPTPDNPIDIISNNGALKPVRTRNLFNKNTIITGYFYNDSGVYTTNANCYTSDKIPVGAQTNITMSCSSRASSVYLRMHAFDSNDNWLSMVAKSVSTSSLSVSGTTPNNTAYIRVCGSSRNNLNDEDTQVEVGSTQTPYVPYYVIDAVGTVETINIHGKNLYDDTTMRTTNPMAIGNNVMMWRYEQSSSATAIKVPVKPNTTYTLSYTGGNRCFIGGFINDVPLNPDTRIDCDFYIHATASAVSPKTFTTPANCNFVCCGLANASGGTVSNIQLEEGSTATDYVPYYNGDTATAEMLLKVGNWQDEQEIISGVVTRNVGTIILDGTEEWGWTPSSVWPVRLHVETVQTPQTQTPDLISNMFIPTPWSGGNRNIPNMSIIEAGNRINFTIRWNPNITTLDDWKQYLAEQYNAGTPVIVVYPLATPTTESVAGQSMATTQGDNIVEITQASLDGLELEATYTKSA